MKPGPRSSRRNAAQRNQVMTPQATFGRRGEELQYDRVRWGGFEIPGFHLSRHNILATDKWLRKSFLHPRPSPKERIIGKSITRSKHLIIQTIIRQWDRKWGWEASADKPAEIKSRQGSRSGKREHRFTWWWMKTFWKQVIKTCRLGR